MPSLPSSLGLTTIPNGSALTSSPVRNNFTAIQVAINDLITALDDGVAGQFLGGVGAALAFGYPPGYQYQYSSTAADVSVTGTASGSATSVFAGGPITFDGTTTIEVEFFCAALTRGTSSIQVGLYDGSTYIGNLFYLDQAGNMPAGKASYVVTPTAAAHTYNVKAFVDAGTGTVRGSGVGGLPIFMRITKV